jgi:predicted polyphosphate/ATP-dependent NAD kinase
MAEVEVITIGLLVNPIAGLGGTAALKGTDAADAPARARALGALPQAELRAARALRALQPVADRLALLVGGGALGQAVAAAAGLVALVVGPEPATPSTATDTANVARAMAQAGAKLLLFAGGDGTARDILLAAPGVPLLGIPAGVKMHSAVFAQSPAAAGDVAAALVATPPQAWVLHEAEVLDLDEALLARGIVAPRLHGLARVPRNPACMQAPKAAAAPDDQAMLHALATRLAATMPRGVPHVLGCGTTLRLLKQALGFEGTLLGIDVVLDGRAIATDVEEARLLRLIGGGPARIVTGITGGQGFLFGRGNQQISAAVLARVLAHGGADAITIMAGQTKLTALDPPCLRVDTGDASLDAALAGYRRVLTGPGRAMMMRVAA